MKPLGDTVIVKVIPEEEKKTAAGLVIPNQNNSKQEKAEVVAVGPGTDRYKIQGKPGDIALIGRNSGTHIEVDGQEYRMMRESSLLCYM